MRQLEQHIKNWINSDDKEIFIITTQKGKNEKKVHSKMIKNDKLIQFNQSLKY